MNIRVVRNLALIGMMGGALFFYNNKKAQAQTQESCSSCSTQEEICYADACGDQNPCPPQPDCQDSYAECLATCSD
jgi:hypothetical protein